MSTPPTRPNPYVGPRAFRTGETLYGRDRELRELLDLLIAERIILLHSPSGAGKSSLIQAGLLPRLQEESFHVLPSMRVNLEPLSTSTPDGFNRYTYSALISLEEDLPEEHQTPADKLAGMTLAEYLSGRPRPEEDGSQPEVLIFDQFEEVLTIDPTDQDGKLAFFTQIGEALRDRTRWALFSMREDYIAALDPYLRPVPTRLGNTYRLDLLKADAARLAIQLPTRKEGVDFTDSASQKLVDDLRRVQVQQPDGSLQEQPGVYVEPVQLQVVCYRLWENLDPDDKQITDDDIAKVGDVNQSLSEYYAERVAAAAQETGVSERAIRDWFEHRLITEQGIRGQVLMGQGQSDGLDNRAIRLLENAHLVRSDKRRGATWFELAHDRLIGPVRSNNEAWYQANLVLLQRQASLWQRDNRPAHLLLREEALQEAESWAGAHPGQLTDTEGEFLEACKEARQRQAEQRQAQEQAIKLAEQTRSARRLRVLLAVAVIAAIAALYFAFSAVAASNRARYAASTSQVLAVVNATVAGEAQAASTQAVANAATSQANAKVAQAASTQASGERATADVARGYAQAASTEAFAQRATAEYNADIAATNEAEAEMQADLATSRQLAAQAFAYLNNQTALASLLGVEAFYADQTWEARSFLLTRLQRALQLSIQPFGQPIASQEKDLYSVALSPDGAHMAWGNSDGSVVLWDYQLGKAGWVKKGHAGRVFSMAFSPDGKTLASGAQDGKVLLWDVAEGTTRELTSSSNVLGLAFSPDGEQIAAGGGSQVIVWDLTTLERLSALDYGGGVYGIAWSPTENRIAIAGGDGSVSLWTPGAALPDSQYNVHQDIVQSVSWSPDGKLVASGSRDGYVVLTNVAAGRTVGKPLRGIQYDWVYSVSFSPDGNVLASASADGAVTLWNVDLLTEIARLEQHDDIVRNVAFSPKKGRLLFASVGLDNAVKLNELIPQQAINEPAGNARAPVLAVSVDSTGQLLTAVDTGSGVRISALEGGGQGGFTLGPVTASLAFSLDGTHLAIGETGGQAQLVEVPGGEQVNTFRVASTAIESVALSKDGSQLAASYCSVIGVSRGNQPICTTSIIQVWDVTSQNPALTLEENLGVVSSLAFDPLGRFLVSGSTSNGIQLWELPSGTAHGVPLGASFVGVTSLAFSPDGAVLAAGYADQTIALWDIDTHQAIGEPLTGAPENVLSLAFTLDGTKLLSGSLDGTLLYWDVSLDSWVSKVCDLAGRNLSNTEWEQFFPYQTYRKTCPQFQEGG